jgi:hypothetical protein
MAIGSRDRLAQRVSKMQPNPAVEPTATSHTVEPMLMVDSITPSRRLLSHPARRRSALELTGVFCQVAVAHFFR